MNYDILISILLISILILCYYNKNYFLSNKIQYSKTDINLYDSNSNINLYGHKTDINLYDRKTKQIVKEFIPLYIKVVLKIIVKFNNNKMLKNKSLKWIKKISIKQGNKFNNPKSIKYIKKYIKLYNIKTDEIEKNIYEYKTFNEFFSRGLKYNSRPIYAINDPNLAVCIADSRLIVFNNINKATELWIKGNNFSIENLVYNNKLYSNLFHDGSICIFRLAPQDYHRWHLPVNGVISNNTLIDGSLYSINPIFINRNIDVLTENKRMIIEFNSLEFGKILIIPIGTVLVGSIKIIANENIFYNKGSVHGYFEFGGSTVILLFENNRIKFDDDILNNSNMSIETLVKMGMSLGKKI
jgi:phosphatidylserine decarboxylase